MVSGTSGRPKAASRVDFPEPEPREAAPLVESAAIDKLAYLTSSTSSKPSSTGVARPKIETETLTRCFS